MAYDLRQMVAALPRQQGPRPGLGLGATLQAQDEMGRRLAEEERRKRELLAYQLAPGDPALPEQRGGLGRGALEAAGAYATEAALGLPALAAGLYGSSGGGGMEGFQRGFQGVMGHAFEPETYEGAMLKRGADKVLGLPGQIAGSVVGEATGSPLAGQAAELAVGMVGPGKKAPKAPQSLGFGVPVGGNVGLLGTQLPKAAPQTLDEALAAGPYELGNAPGVYGHEVAPKVQRIDTPLPREINSQLAQAEKDMAGFLTRQDPSLSKADAKERAKAIVAQERAKMTDYQATHHPKAGWAPPEVTGIKPQLNEVTGVPELGVSYKAMTPQFQIDMETGKAFAPNSPNRAVFVEDTSNKMVQGVLDIVERAHAGDVNAQYLVDQANWYADAQKSIRELFGKDSGLYAEIQASMSPNTRLSIQHKFADEIFKRGQAGEFDETMVKFEAHMAKRPDDIPAPAWAKQLQDQRSPNYDPSAIIKQANGNLYGMNGINAQLAMSKRFNEVNPGMAPKMRNFGGNLTGSSIDPTIDVWAGRDVNELAGGLRIPPERDTGVPGSYNNPSQYPAPQHYENALKLREGLQGGAEALSPRKAKQLEKLAAEVDKSAWAIPAPKISGQYGVAHDVYQTAAQKLGMEPRALQALRWFATKHDWEKKGWTPRDAQPSLVDLIKRDNPQ